MVSRNGMGPKHVDCITAEILMFFQADVGRILLLKLPFPTMTGNEERSTVFTTEAAMIVAGSSPTTINKFWNQYNNQ